MQAPVHVLREELENKDGFLLKLRGAEGFDDAGFERVTQALRQLASDWKPCTHIPKDVVQLIYWLGPAIEACSFGYRGPEAERIRAKGMEVTELVSEVFGG